MSKKEKVVEVIRPNDLARWYKKYNKKLEAMSSMESCNLKVTDEMGDCNNFVSKRINLAIQSYLKDSGWIKAIKIGKYIGEDEFAVAIEYEEDNRIYQEAIKKGTKIAILDEGR